MVVTNKLRRAMSTKQSWNCVSHNTSSCMVLVRVDQYKPVRVMGSKVSQQPCSGGQRRSPVTTSVHTYASCWHGSVARPATPSGPLNPGPGACKSPWQRASASLMKLETGFQFVLMNSTSPCSPWLYIQIFFMTTGSAEGSSSHLLD